MSKKSFKGGIDGLLGGDTKAASPNKKGTRGRPKTNFKEVTKTSQKGTKENETRATFIVNEEVLEKVKALAYWERTSIKEVLAEALADHIKSKKSEVTKAVNAYKKSKA